MLMQHMFSLTSYVWTPLNGFEYLPPQMPSRAQIKGKLCIEYPFIFRGLEKVNNFAKLNLFIFRSNALHSMVECQGLAIKPSIISALYGIIRSEI